MASFVSTFILLVIAVGWFFRRHVAIHIPCMVVAFLMDLTLLLYIEGTRQAIHTVTDSLKTPAQHAFLLFHVSVSLLVILLYLVQMVSGIVLKRKPGILSMRNAHKMSAIAFIVCRSANYITSFFVGQPHH